MGGHPVSSPLDPFDIDEPWRAHVPASADPGPRPAGGPRSSWSLSRGTRLWLVGLALVMLVLWAGTLVHPRYVIYRPGPVLDTLGSAGETPFIDIRDRTTYPTTGSLDATTVSMWGGPGYDVNVWEYLQARVDDDAIVQPYAEVFPETATAEQVKEETHAEMVGSQEDAVAVALRAVDLKVPEKVVVTQVLQEGPAAGRLRPDDVITAVGSTPVVTRGDVRKLLQTSPAGGSTTVTVLRDRKQFPVSVTPIEHNGVRLLGIGLTSTFTFPVKVTVNAGAVGGPSAGLMFSLGIFDKLTPGSLTGGKKIAGTGTIDSSGQVGPIGGIQLKMRGAARAGATWFLAPVGDCSEVVGHVPDGLRDVKVATFAEGRAAVEAIAAGTADSLPRCS